MNTIKKLVLTMMAVLFITLGFDHVAYATELAIVDNTTDTNISDVVEGPDTDEADLKDVIDGANAEIADDASDDELIEIADDADDVDDGLNEDVFDKEKYETYEDEQGQIYYIEKEPEEQAIIDNDEDMQEQEEKAQKKEKPSYTEKDLRLLSSLVYAEAGNQSYKGMLAVANVVLNRVKSDCYKHVDTVEEVIYDKKWAVQFTVTIKSRKSGKSALDKAMECYDTGEFKSSNPEAERKAMNKAIKAAKAALTGDNNIGDYLYFKVNRNTAKIRNNSKKYKYTILEDHIFYCAK